MQSTPQTPHGLNSPWASWVATWPCRLPPLSGTVQSHGGSDTGHRLTHSCHSQAVSSVSPSLGESHSGTNEKYGASRRTWCGGDGIREGWDHRLLVSRDSQLRNKARKLLERRHVTCTLWPETPSSHSHRKQAEPWVRWSREAGCTHSAGPPPGLGRQKLCVTLLNTFPDQVDPMVLTGTATPDSYQGPVVMTEWARVHPKQCGEEQRHNQTAPPPPPSVLGTQASPAPSCCLPYPWGVTLFPDFQKMLKNFPSAIGSLPCFLKLLLIYSLKILFLPFLWLGWERGERKEEVVAYYYLSYLLAVKTYWLQVI